MSFESKNQFEILEKITSSDPAIRERGFNELANKLVISLITNHINALDIDKILIKAIKIPDQQKFRRTILSSQEHCSICGSKKKIELHHIKPQRDYPELKYDIGNIMVLCRDCHDIIHNRANKKFYDAKEYRENFKTERNKLYEII